ncbi:Lrp/AsnC ligand binding domain-containing protein [Thermoactinomyces sp. CICC 10521]|uniref:Lrp/AsnC ligand binding domain-containing protein n=1 Tax=Thermoactinomyces sp. CICC 10521 TaxID=2767426 RepID=UPI0018DE13E8|nr:Lrp/AsnC ligand binding domain-containing protein [Thermoactinomyces sp. CICC 10521]
MQIKEEPAISECHRVTGSMSYFIKAAVPSMWRWNALSTSLPPLAGSILPSYSLLQFPTA